MKNLITGISMAAAAVTAAWPALAAGDVCLSPAESAAYKVRHLQTQMMIGALQCRGTANLGQRAYYNQFVTKYRATLKQHGTDLIGYFQRQHGPGYRKVLDQHITKLANQVSLESQRVDDFCERIAAVGQLLVGDSTVAIADAVGLAPVRYRPLTTQCTGPGTHVVTVD